ncbi:MAG TPA: hypothetical protein ENJ77_00300 [Candidatus Moranbacteria bacterium]|nr:hypothetical protein [Candidatus Moranbacteria bacterium]
MKTSINLLFVDEKKAWRRRLRAGLAVSFAAALLAVGLLAAIVLGSMVYALSLEEEIVGEEAGEISAQIDDAEKNERFIKITNNKIKRLSQRQKKAVPFSSFLIFLAEKTPPGVKAEKITFEYVSSEDNRADSAPTDPVAAVKEKKKSAPERVLSLKLAGLAENRDDVLLLRERLSREECLEKIDLPLSGLVRKENVSFVVSAEIKPACQPQI